MKLDIYSNKYNSIFHPFHLESLYHLSQFIENVDYHLSFEERKKIVLEILNFLLENNIIYVLKEDFMQNKENKKKILSDKEIISKINDIWREDTPWEDLYFMLWFRFQNWYRDKLVSIGLENKPIDWNEFINNNIGDLEKWIMENKTKNNTGYNNGYK